MVAVLLGLAASASFSCADFFGGVAARRSEPWLSVLANQVVGLLPLSVYLVLLYDQGPSTHDLVLSAGAGLASVAGLGMLFGGFAVGRMAVVAPVSAGIGGLVPIAWGLLQGERPGALAFLGAVIVLTASVVLARSEGDVADADLTDPDDGRAALMAVGAGVAFGLVLVLFSETSDDIGLWPPFAAHLVAIPTLTVGLLVAGHRLRPPTDARKVMVASGFFDATAVSLLLVALQQDELVSLVAPAANLYPAGTALLAALVLKERLHGLQIAALVAAAVGLVLLATG
jgi:drug/metabolite transporter (DMT)-like permease